MLALTRHWLFVHSSVVMILTFACATAPKAEVRRSTRMVDAGAAAPIPRPKVRGVESASKPVREKSTVLATYRVERRVGLFYKVDLGSDNAYAPLLVEMLRLNDDRLRACFDRPGDDVPVLRGQLVFSFEMWKGLSGARKVNRVGGNLEDKAQDNCLAHELAGMAFAPPRALKGRVLFSYIVDEAVAQMP